MPETKEHYEEEFDDLVATMQSFKKQCLGNEQPNLEKHKKIFNLFSKQYTAIADASNATKESKDKIGKVLYNSCKQDYVEDSLKNKN